MQLDPLWNSLIGAEKSPLNTRGFSSWLRETSLVRAAPVISGRDEFGTSFSFHPRADLAGPRNWCWIFAVRMATDPYPFEIAIEAGHQAIIDELRCLWHLFFGDIVDLVAVTQDYSRIVGRFTGVAQVLGYPQQNYGDNDEKIRVFRTVDGWLRNKLQGVVMLGTAEENQRWLSDWRGGVVCDDIAHGKQIYRLLKKPYSGPRVMVDA